jgi:hypothetical protein
VKPHIVEPSSEDHAKLNSFLDQQIYEFNNRATGFRNGRPFAGVIKDESAKVIAAIIRPYLGQVLPR